MTFWSDSVFSPLRQTVHRSRSRPHRGRKFNWRLMLALVANAFAWWGIIHLATRFAG
jgi:hypothetical protein